MLRAAVEGAEAVLGPEVRGALGAGEWRHTVFGVPVVDAQTWRACTHYYGFQEGSEVLDWFWAEVGLLSGWERRWLLHWCLGYAPAPPPPRVDVPGVQPEVEGGRTANGRGGEDGEAEDGMRGGREDGRQGGEREEGAGRRREEAEREYLEEAQWVVRAKHRWYFGSRVVAPPFTIARHFRAVIGRNSSYCELLLPTFSERSALAAALHALLPTRAQQL